MIEIVFFIRIILFFVIRSSLYDWRAARGGVPLGEVGRRRREKRGKKVSTPNIKQ